MSDTFGDLVDRTLRDWLTPPDDQPTRMELAADLTASATSFSYDASILLPEQELLLGPGALIEVEQEQMLVEGVDTEGNTVTVIRGVNGTDKEAHEAGDLVTISPTFGRRSVADALGSAIVGLYPRLHRRRAIELTVQSGYTEIPADAEVPEQFVYFNGDYPLWPRIRFVTLPTLSTGRAMLTLDAPSGTTGTLVYRGRFTAPSSEADVLDDLGVLPEYEQAIMVRAVAHIVASRDLDALTTEFLTRQLEAQTNQGSPGTRLREALLRYYEYLMTEVTRNVEAIRFHNGWVRGGEH